MLPGERDRPIRLWDARRNLAPSRGIPTGSNSVAFSPDGTRLLSGSADKTLKLWDVATGQSVRTFEGHSGWSVDSVAFSPDGTRIVSAELGQDAQAVGCRHRTVDPHLRGTYRRRCSVAFSPDGTRLLSGDVRGALKLWDAFGGRLLRTFEGHSGWVPSVGFSPDGRRVVSGSLDTTMRIWDAETGAQLAMLVGGRDGQWLALTPTGFFASSPSAYGLLAIAQGLDVTTIDQVHQSLFNPDLVREALAGDPGGEVQEAAKVINLEKVLDSGPAPSVAIASPCRRQPVCRRPRRRSTARIEDRGKGVGRIEWRVNGITAAVAAKPEGDGPVYTITRQLALDPGDNTIEVVAYNGSNLLASLPARTTVKFTGPADKMRPKLHILAIGINKYVDKGWTPPGSTTNFFFEPLDLAVKDAKAFAASMKKAAAGLYDEVLVTEVLDQDATRENLAKIVDKVAASIHPRDTFILFAAAHGYSKDERPLLSDPAGLPGRHHPEALANRAIGQDQLQDWLANRIKAKNALILLDTCEFGALIAGHARSRTDAGLRGSRRTSARGDRPPGADGGRRGPVRPGRRDRCVRREARPLHLGRARRAAQRRQQRQWPDRAQRACQPRAKRHPENRVRQGRQRQGCDLRGGLGQAVGALRLTRRGLCGRATPAVAHQALARETFEEGQQYASQASLPGRSKHIRKRQVRGTEVERGRSPPDLLRRVLRERPVNQCHFLPRSSAPLILSPRPYPTLEVAAQVYPSSGADNLLQGRE